MRHVGWGAAALLMLGCSAPTTDPSATTAGERATTAPSTSAVDVGDPGDSAGVVPSSSLAAESVGSTVAVRATVEGPVTHTFDNPTSTGVPLTFAVLDRREGWLEVQLPVRPNGTTGWVEAQQVTVREVRHFLRVSTSANTLELYRDGELVEQFPVATGTGDTPTPLGTFYLTELVAPTNEGYGPFAYGISAYSDVLNEFLGGPGQIGLHGTDDAGSIGRAASHGCIRMDNDDITTLSALLPLGTPIEITE
jgi:lipoprotein-anchoring transpeptidase ErfK/SrfK